MSTFKDVTILNTETTGVDYANDEIIALAVGRLSNSNNWMADVTYFDSDVEITPEISAIHDITSDMLGDQKFYEAISDLQVDFKDYVISHNAPFHASMINRNGVNALKDKKVICTMRMAKKLTTLGLEVDNFKLNYLRYYYGVEVNRNDFVTNTEMTNVVTAKLFENQVNILLELGVIESLDFEEVYEWVEAPIIYERMTFGKHAGKLFSEIPTDYWRWALANLDSLQEGHERYDADLAASIAEALL